SYDDSPKMNASGLPDFNNPMPEFVYIGDDVHTNSSVAQKRLDCVLHDDASEDRATPTLRYVAEQRAEIAASRHRPGVAQDVGSTALGPADGLDAPNDHS
ncbi:hypothetical protein H9Q71_014531, partial [Fusarium xylarioides]